MVTPVWGRCVRICLISTGIWIIQSGVKLSNLYVLIDWVHDKHILKKWFKHLQIGNIDTQTSPDRKWETTSHIHTYRLIMSILETKIFLRGWWNSHSVVCTSAWIRLSPVSIICTVECASSVCHQTQLHSAVWAIYNGLPLALSL